MTVETRINKVKYVGDGAAAEFPAPFPVIDEGHLRLYLLADGAETEVLSGFSVIGAGTSAVSVRLDQPLAAGVGLTILRQLPLVQPMDLVNGGDFNAETLEESADNQVMQIQQLAEELDRAIKVPVTSEPPYPSSEDFLGRIKGYTDDARGSAERAAALVDPVAIASGMYNVRKSWIAPEAVASGGVLRLPGAYFPGRDVLTLWYQGALCVPRKPLVEAAGAYQYEEVGDDIDTPGQEVVIHFDVAAGDLLDMLVISSAAASTSRAEAAADRAGAAADAAAGDAVVGVETRLAGFVADARAAAGEAGEAADRAETDALLAETSQAAAQDAATRAGESVTTVEGYASAAWQSADQAGRSAIAAYDSETAASAARTAAQGASAAAGQSAAAAEVSKTTAQTAAANAAGSASSITGAVTASAASAAAAARSAAEAATDADRAEDAATRAEAAAGAAEGGPGALPASQAEVDAGTVVDKFVSPKTLAGRKKAAVGVAGLVELATTADTISADKAATPAGVAAGVAAAIASLTPGGIGALPAAGTAVAAAKLATARSISGVSFDGTKDITLGQANVGLDKVDNTADAAKSVASAAKLSAPRTISLTGKVTGSASFDGSANAAIAVTVANDVVAAGKLSAALAAGANYTVPGYVVGSGKLKIYYDGLLCRAGADAGSQYQEVGAAGAASTTIKFFDALPIGAELTAISEV